MKNSLLIVLTTAFFSIPVSANAAKQGVYSPERGVICDKVANFCSDMAGISIGITEMYLGASSSKLLLDMINKVGADNFNSRVFILSNGVKCDVNNNKCTKSKFDETIDTQANNWLFGTTENPTEKYNHLEGKSVKIAEKELSHAGYKIKGTTDRLSAIWFNRSNKQCLEIYTDSGLIGSIQSSDSDLCR